MHCQMYCRQVMLHFPVTSHTEVHISCQPTYPSLVSLVTKLSVIVLKKYSVKITSYILIIIPGLL